VSTTALVLAVAGILVAFIVASFTNVVIDRMPLALDEPNEYGEVWDTRTWPEVAGGRSRCSSCGADVRPVDNIPVVSFLVLRGRCRDCGEPYGAFHLLVELAVPAVGVLLTWLVVSNVGWTWALVPWWILVPVGIAVAVIDLRTLIVPTRIIWPATGVTAVAIVAAALLEGEPTWMLGALLGVVAMAGPIFLIWFIVPTGMGFGDVRLCVLLGLNVGLAACVTGRSPWWALMLGIICLAVSSLTGVVTAIPGLVVGRRHIPFGPALVFGALFCVALAAPILEPFG